MKILVTGSAGFIGSTLVEKLAVSGHEVIAVDCFLNESYSPEAKRKNIQNFSSDKNISFVEFDLRQPLDSSLLDGVSYVVNEAAMPGLVKSWLDIDTYLSCNTTVVSNLCKSIIGKDIKLIQASTSSVYGHFATGDEFSQLEPASPYGISKLAAEQIIKSYRSEFGLEYVILRYFSVYGPRQRPDMAYNKIIHAILHNKEISIYGDGLQTRTNTYVDDIVNATILSMNPYLKESILNVGGSEEFSLLEAIAIIEKALGRKATITWREKRPGDQVKTIADTNAIKKNLAWEAQTRLEEGLLAQIEWQASAKNE